MITTQESKFQRLLDAAGIRYFSAREVFFKGHSHTDPKSRAFGLNTEPPEILWPHIMPTLRVLDALRAQLKQPISLVSIYRSPAYNRAIGSTNPVNPRVLTGKGSQHPRFSAADIKVRNISPAAVHAALLAMRRQGIFAGGLGIYHSFVHIDTRGYNASWKGAG